MGGEQYAGMMEVGVYLILGLTRTFVTQEMILALYNAAQIKHIVQPTTQGGRHHRTCRMRLEWDGTTCQITMHSQLVFVTIWKVFWLLTNVTMKLIEVEIFVIPKLSMEWRRRFKGCYTTQ